MKKHTPYQLILESLEERVFFDANPVAVIVEPTDGGVEDATPDGAQMQAESEAVAEVKDETTNTPLEEGGGEQPDDDAASPDKSDTLLGESQENVAEEVDASGGAVADKDGDAGTDGLVQNTTTTETLEDSGGSDQGATDTETETTDQDHNVILEQVDTDTSEVDRVIFVDDKIKDFDNLLQGVATDVAGLDETFDVESLLKTGSAVVDNTEIVVLDHTSDELNQISETLGEHKALNSVHIFSYGSQNSLALGDTTLTTSNLDDYSNQVSGWGEALSKDGDILLYGCNIAQDVTENNFIEAFAQLTEADVAASDDQTGNQAIGGDWDLEVTSGDVDTTALQDATGQWEGLLDPMADSTLSVANKEPMINSAFDFEVTFDNTDAADVGYGPFVDVVVPKTLDINGGPKYLNQPVAHTVYTWDATGNVWQDSTSSPVTEHPSNSDSPAVTLGLPAGKNDGDKWYHVELPFGSFTPDQPKAAIAFNAQTSSSAEVGVGIDITSKAGFKFGDTATNDNGPLQEADLNTLTITPKVIDIEKSNDAPEKQTATGPNYPVEYTLKVNVAAGETVNDVVVQDYLPENAVYRGDVKIIPINSAAPFTGSTAVPDDFVVLGADRLLKIDFGNLTGVTSAADGTSHEYQITYTVYFSNVQSDNSSTLLPQTGDDVNNVLNEASVTGTYGANAVTVSDGIDVGVDLGNLNGNDNDTLSDNEIQIASLVTYKDVKVVGGGNPAPGKTLEWSIEVDISDYYTADNIVLNDVFGDGQTFDANFTPTLKVHENGTEKTYTFANTNFTVGVEDALNAAGDTALTFNVSTLLAAEASRSTLKGGIIADNTTGSADEATDALNGRIGGDGTRFYVVYHTTIDQEYDKLHTGNSGDASVDIGDEIHNKVTVNADISDGTTTEAQEDSSQDHVEIPGGKVEKTIYAVNGNTGYDLNKGVQSGDKVTYRLKMELPSADFEKLIVRDFLPLPVYDARELIVKTTDDFISTNPGSTTETGVVAYSGGEIAFGPDHNLNDSKISGLKHNGATGDTSVTSFLAPGVKVDSANNLVELDFGSYDATSSTGATIDILLTLTINDQPMVDGLQLTNQGEWTINDTTNNPDLEVKIQQVKMNAPEVAIVKGVVGIDNSSGTLPAGSQGPLTFKSDGTIDLTGGVVEAADLIAKPVDGDLTGADGGDLVTFALTIYNTGGNDAYDINVKDTLPTGFVKPGDINSLNLHVYQGSSATEIDGGKYSASLNGAKDTLTVNFEDVALKGDPDNREHGGGNDVFIVTYQLAVDNETAIDTDVVTAGSTHTNKATVDFFTGTDNSTTDWTAVLGEPSDDAKVVIAEPTVAKTLVGTEIVDGTNANNEAVIGEVVTYQVVVTLPEGVTQGAMLQDKLDSGLTFGKLVSVTPSAGVSTDKGDFSTISNFTATPSGDVVKIDLGSITNVNGDNATAETVTLVYTAYVNNSSGNQSTTQLNNAAHLSFTGGDGASNIDSADNVTVIEPQLEVVKTVDVGGDSSGDAGDPVIYTIVIKHNAASETTAYDVDFSDQIPGDIVGASLTAVVDSAGSLSTTNFDLTGNLLTLNGTIDMLEARVVTLTVTGTLAGNVAPNQTINNDATVTWQSLDTPHTNNGTNERTGDGGAGGLNDYSATGTANINISAIGITKTLIDTEISEDGGVNDTTIDKLAQNERLEATIGEKVTYEVVLNLPEGQLNNAQLVDVLDTGLQFVEMDSIDVSSGLALTTTPTTASVSGTGATGNQQTITFDLGTVTHSSSSSTGTPETVTIRYTAIVLDDAANVEGRSDVDNAARLVWDAGSGPGTGSSVTADAEDLTIIEPQITTTKSVVDSADAGTDAQPGEVLTYTVILKNTGSSTAYETVAVDTLAPGTVYDTLVSVDGGSSTIPVDYNNTAGTVTFGSLATEADSWDIAAGAEVKIVYTVKVATAGFTAVTHENTVNANWSHKDGITPQPLERIYNDSNNYAVDGEQDVSKASFVVNTPGSLGNYVYFDSDGQGGDYNPAGGDVGINGVKVTISANLDGQGTPDYTQTVTTDENGHYSFTNLAIYDNYTITVDHSGTGGGFNLDGAGYTQTYDKDEGTVALDNVATSIAITAAAPVRTDINFGYTGSQSVGDLVWYDRDADGAQPNVDTGEAGLGGVKVQLKADIDGDSKIDYTAEVVTKSDGSYEFANLPGGSYTISAVPGAGYLATWDLDSTVTGGAADNSTAFILPATGGSRDDVDFGLRGNASVSERVFFDVNNSGGDYQPGADLGIGKVDVRLSADFDGDGTPDYTLTTTTDDGSYSFNNLLPGDYTITVDTTDLPVGMKQVYDAGEPNSGNFNNSHTLTLADGDAISTVNFGYTGSGSIEKYVWWDADASGTRDAGEVGLAGVELQLKGDFDGDNTIETIATTKTDADGKYIFDNLPSGSYTVTILSGIPASATETYDLDGVANGNKATNYSLGFNSLTGEVEKTELVNFGFNGKGVIGDTVWLDANDDGVFDAGTESGIAGVTVTLSADLDGQNGDKEFVVTTQTDANGKYSFDGLFTSVAGINYTVAVDNTTLPASATLTHDLDDKADGSVVTTTPGSAVVTLTDGAPEGLDTDFGYDIFSTIGDRVWLDNNGDGVQDAGEIGLAGITVKLFDGSGAQVETVVTDSSGKYVFTHLKAGDYRVETDNLPEGVRQTFDADGTLTANSATVTIGTGQTNLAVDFGYEATGSIGDRVWNNIDGDPTDNGGTEPGIPGVTVTLTGDFNNDGTVTPDETRSVVTDANGNYLFDNLIAGDYTVEVSDLPVGSVQNFDPDGTANNSTNVTLGGGQPLNTDAIDFGYRQAGAIGDRVWYDLNADGVQDVGENGLGRVTVKLFDGNDNLIAEVDTDSSGNYLFTDLNAGDYYVVVDNADLPGGMVQTHDRDDTNPAGPFTTPHRSDLITLGDKETVLDVDFGYTGSGSIGQVIWQDVNGNPIQDGGEPGVAGVTVTVRGDFNNDGDFNDPEDLMTTVTDANGNYSFTHLPQGPYTVTVDTSTLPPGMKPSTDSDGLATPHTVTGTLTGATNNNFNFGYQQFSAIGDYVWYDIDGDGVKDPGELPIKGAQVSLTGDFDGDGDIDSVTITTDKNGFYLFDSNLITSNIAPGDYTVSVALPAALQGTEQTYDSDGLATPNSSNLTIAAGEVNLDQDFGFRGTGSIGDTVWYDLDEDGIVDPGEEGISGVKVTLEGDLDGDGVTDIVLETTTDANGKYSFDHLFAGAYTITSNPATATSNFSPVSDPDGTPDNRTTIKLGGGEKNSNINFGYKPINVPTETPAPEPESPTTTASPTTTKSQASPIPVRPYDSLFSSYVEDGENRDVQRWIDERPEEPVYQKPLLPVNPIYTGHAEPGTTLVINLTDAQGNSVGSQLVMADTGGNWLANFGGSLMYDMPHNIEIHQNSSLYNSSSAGGFNLRTYFMPALSNSPFTLSEQTMESIFATRPFAILQTLGEHYNQSAGLGWNDFYDYEYKAVSTNPSQSTL